MNYLDFVLSAQKFGEPRGIPSVCSAYSFVLEAALRHGLAHDTPVLIEATCNQVNQFGGYTGLTPGEFVGYVNEIAAQTGFPRANLLLGGDHLGPLVWATEPAASAMDKAQDLVAAYCQAGFGKIHLDCSMPLADDRDLPVELVARRAAQLAAVAEKTCRTAGLPLPRYVIGTEVPHAGGAKAGEAHLTVTDPAAAAETIELTRCAFAAQGLEAAWERVIALVVQPGVEFSDTAVHEYDRAAASGLKAFIENVPGMVYEAHSTDYQTRQALRQLVEDHFAILKVGPALTFAFREGVFALAEMEEILGSGEPSNIRETLEMNMRANPAHWQNHYGPSPRQPKLALFYSFSDRIRYYWHTPAAQTAFARLLQNLGDDPLPLSLLSQYLPEQYEKIRNKEMKNHPREVLLGQVMDVLGNYAAACSGVCR